MARRKESITLTDPKALRALAHPARQMLIRELFSGRVLTATEAAQLVDLTPSAVSHHLRALEKWGLARRAKQSADRRQRPWEGTAKRLNIQPSEAGSSERAVQSFAVGQITEFSRRLEAFLPHQRSDPWHRDWSGLSTAEVWLTREQLQTIQQAVTNAIKDQRGANRRAQGARRVSLVWSAMPTDPEG